MFRGGAVPFAAFAAMVLGILSPTNATAQNQPIGAFTAEPVNQNVGPQQAKGLIVYSHGYTGGLDHTQSPNQPYVKAIPVGVRYFIAKFLDDEYDVGGTLEATKAVFAQHGVDAVLLNYPAGFSGHHAADKNNFDKVYGPCMFKFIETGVGEPPCIGI